VIAHNAISDSVGYGGGIAVEGGGPVTLTGNTIMSNAAATITSTIPQSDVGYGGGVYVRNAPVRLTGNVVQSNAANAVSAFGFGGAFGYGGGIYIIHSPAFTLTRPSSATRRAINKLLLVRRRAEVDSAGYAVRQSIAGNRASSNVLFGNGGGGIFTST
jgi:hypothetical protein